MMSSDLLLVEMGAGGHHTVYSKVMLDGGYDGHFLISSDTWESLPQTTRDHHRAKVHVVPNIAWERRRQVELIFEFVRAHPEVTRCFMISYSEVFFPLLRQRLKLLGRAKNHLVISGLWNADNLFESRRESLTRRLRWWGLFSVKAAILTLSPGMRMLYLNADYAAAFHRLPWLRSRTKWCPEPIEPPEPSVGMRSRSAKREVPCLLFAGYHSVRKGTVWALEALSSWSKPLHIVVAGPSEYQQLTDDHIAKLPACIKVTLDSKRLNQTELAAHFDAADFVILPYRRFGSSSSILINALQHGKPVLATDYGMMSRQIRALGCGRVFQPDDRQDFLDQLHKLIDDPPDLNANRRIEEFLDQRSASAFYQVVFSAAAGHPKMTQSAGTASRRSSHQST